jgi:G patch domain-containing protein 1
MLETSGRALTARSDTATPERATAPEVRKEAVIEPERNEALEAERPGEAVFKAIFGSDDEDEEE